MAGGRRPWQTVAMRRTRSIALALSVLLLGGWEPLWRTDPDVDAGNRAYADQRAVSSG